MKEKEKYQKVNLEFESVLNSIETAVAFFTAVAVFHAAISCAAAAAFSVNGFAVVAVGDMGILMSMRYGNGTCYSNAEYNKYDPLHYSSFLFELHG